MRCPMCNAYGLAIAASRPYEGTIRRRRKCLNCGYRFTTYEISEEEYRKVENNKAYIADVLSYLEDFFQKVSERKTKQHGNNQNQISSGC